MCDRVKEAAFWGNSGHVYLPDVTLLKLLDRLNWLLLQPEKYIGDIPNYNELRIKQFAKRVRPFNANNLLVSAPKKMFNGSSPSLFSRMLTAYREHNYQQLRETVAGLQSPIPMDIDPVVWYKVEFGYVFITGWGE
jgi:hypothetical protein